MYNFDVARYETVVNDAVALIPQIEKAADEISKAGFRNIFFIGCGGTYAHSLPMQVQEPWYMSPMTTPPRANTLTTSSIALQRTTAFARPSIPG